MTVSLFLALSVRTICPRLCTGTTIRTIRIRTRRKRPHDPRRAFNPHAERFQADEAELYEEPTIAEMEAAIARETREETGEETSEDGSFDSEPMDDADLALANNALENKPTKTEKNKKGDNNRPCAKRKPAASKQKPPRKNRRGIGNP